MPLHESFLLVSAGEPEGLVICFFGWLWYIGGVFLGVHWSRHEKASVRPGSDVGSRLDEASTGTVSHFITEPGFLRYQGMGDNLG